MIVAQWCGQPVQAVGVEERRIGGTVEERRVPQHVDQQVAVGAYAVDTGAGQGVGKDAGGLPSCRRPRDDLGQHRVVEDRYFRAFDDAAVDAHTAHVWIEFGSGGHVEAVHGARLRLPVLGRVFGVEPGLDGGSARRWGFDVEPSAVGDMQLQLDEVQAGGGLGDGMLDLQPGVHLQEVEGPRPRTVIVSHELDRARAGVPDGLRCQPRGLEELGAHAFRTFDKRRWSLLDDFLVTALDGTFAFADGPHGAVFVGHHLDLDVMTGGQVALAEHRRVAEGRLRFAASGFHLPGQRG